MNVITPGHKYDLLHHSTDPQADVGVETIQFYQRFASENPDEIVNGTTNEEVLDMLIDRMRFLDDRFPSAENKDCIQYLEMARAALAERTKDRQERGVEGTPQL